VRRQFQTLDKCGQNASIPAMEGERAIASLRRRNVLHALEGQDLRLEVLVDDYVGEDGAVIINARHSIARRLSSYVEGTAWINDEAAASFGELVFIPAHMRISVKGNGRKIRLARLEFSEERFPVVSEMLQSLDVSLSDIVDIRHATIARLLLVLAMEAEAPRPAANIYLDGLASVIVAELVRYLSEMKPLSKDFSQKIDLDLDLADDYIRSHIHRRISVSEVADTYGISERHLGRLFRSATGHSVHDYIEHVRIRHATHLLTNKMMSVKQIAYRVGYTSQATFSVAFRRVMGCPPSAYRQSLFRMRQSPTEATTAVDFR
jgi:AraC family transcriptional regulator